VQAAAAPCNRAAACTSLTSWLMNDPRSSPAGRTPDNAERDRLRALLDRLMYTRAEPQRQQLLAQVQGEMQQIRKLIEF
jgi:hypothetical protein